MARIALATCVKLPEPDPDEELLVARLRALGATVRLLPWDAQDGREKAAADELVVVRSTWNYFDNGNLGPFLAWVDTVPRILNPAAVIRANVEKTYLRELEARGIPIVPTAWETADVEATMREQGWERVVIKPTVSGGSFATRLFAPDEAKAAQAFVAETGRPMMIQRWMPAVDTSGERAIVWLDGEVSHAVRKSPRFADEHESVTAVPVAEDERAFAERVLAPLAGELLYARVDVIRDDREELRIMELELVEPSLFLKQHPPALERFASAILRAIR